ncbi:MAG: hypothetical protein IJ010_08090 [Ruminococcus sp.]|nr:hypothetical protein [Ruminococcus sp.]
MLKKFLIGITSVLGASAALLFGGMTAGATTVEDVWQAAREAGYPEYMIQDYYNIARAQKPDPAEWTSENFDKVIAALREHPYITTGPQVTQKITTTTTALPETTTQTNNDEPETPSATEPAPTEPVKNVITLTMADGTTFTRISKQEFIALSYEGKQSYIATFPPEQQQVIIDNLSPEERRSLLKQLPTDKKLETIQGLADVAGEMGVKLTVEELGDDTVKLTVHDEDGKVIGHSSVGADIVENTGYDRRWVFAASGGLFLISIAGVIFLFRKSSLKGRTADEK